MNINEVKIGDRVRIVKDFDFPKIINEIGTIKEIDIEENCLAIDFDNPVGEWFDRKLNIKASHGLYVEPVNIEMVSNCIDLDIKYIDKNITPLVKTEKGDLIDLRASRVFLMTTDSEGNFIRDEKGKVVLEEKSFPYSYKAGDSLCFRLGFALKMPKGYKANVYPRSGTFENYGFILTNSVGQIDNVYSGNNDEWMAKVYCLKNGTIGYDERILQFEAVKAMGEVRLNITEQLDNVDRGGYNSTGVK
jgi:dUTP pyrophosphatase